MNKFTLAVLVASAAALFFSAGSLHQDSAPVSTGGAGALPSPFKKGAKVSVVTLAEPVAAAPQKALFLANVKRRTSGSTLLLFKEDDRLLVDVEVLDVQGAWAQLSWADVDGGPDNNVDIKRRKRAWINGAQIVSIWNE